MKKLKHNDKKSVISSEYYKNEKPVYLCSFCNRTLLRLTDAGQNNNMYWCISCSVEFDPESENIRRESKLEVPDRNVEPAITSITHDYNKDVEIRHEPELRGAFKSLKDKGLRFTSYHTTEKE